MEGWLAASYAVLWLLVVALSVVVVALARQIGTLHMRVGPRGALEMDAEGPPLGGAPPPVEGVDPEGRTVTIGGPGRAQLLLFVSPGCRICEQVLPGLAPAARAHHLAPYVIESSHGNGPPHAVEPDAPSIVSADAVRLYDVPGTPYAVVLDDGGIVRSKGTVNNLEQLEGLVDTASRRASRNGPHPEFDR